MGGHARYFLWNQSVAIVQVFMRNYEQRKVFLFPFLVFSAFFFGGGSGVLLALLCNMCAPLVKHSIRKEEREPGILPLYQKRDCQLFNKN